MSNRHERRRLETRNRLIEAGSELFGEKGIQATKVSDICERADVAQQTFFNHFPGKADLARELTRQGHDFVLAAIEAAHRQGRSTGERIGHFFRTVYEAAAQAGPMHQEMISELIQLTYAEDREGARARQLHAALGTLVRSGIDAGEVTRDHDPEDLVDLIFGSFQVLMSEWASRPGYPIAERAARMSRLLEDALAPRPRRPDPPAM